MDLLTNAVQAIQVGVEDYNTGAPPRLLSAIRNIHAGILLLYKEALRRESPPSSDNVLIKAKIVSARDAHGKVVFIGSGRKTVDSQQIRERFEGLGISTDWKRLERIASARNDAEHYYPQVTQQALHGVIADAFLLIRGFVANELHDDPRLLLGESTWQGMLKVSEVHAEEQRHCRELMSKVDWVSETLESGLQELACNACGSDLLRPSDLAPDKYRDDMYLQCSCCGEVEEAQSFVPRAVRAALSADAYLAAKEGGETPYVSCPECGERAYVMDEERCAVCGESVEHTCIRCGNEIPAEELDSSPLCGWCAHMSFKDD
jgi:hypothetical protein